MVSSSSRASKTNFVYSLQKDNINENNSKIFITQIYLGHAENMHLLKIGVLWYVVSNGISETNTSSYKQNSVQHKRTYIHKKVNSLTFILLAMLH